LHVSNAVNNNFLEEKEKKYGVNPEKTITPEQSPSTKTQLRQVCILVYQYSFYHSIYIILKYIYNKFKIINKEVGINILLL